MPLKKWDGINPLTGDDRNALVDYVLGVHAKAFHKNAGGQQTVLAYQRAFYYNNKTYVCFQGDPPTLDPYIMAFDHVAKKWIGPYKIGTNPLSGDWHGAPAIVMDQNKNIHAFWGSHGSNPGYMKRARTTNPEDISAWTAKSNLIGTYTYPYLFKDSAGNLHMIIRKWVDDADGWDVEVWRKSTDNGETWGSEQRILLPGSSYRFYVGCVRIDATNNRIHLTWFLDSMGTPPGYKQKVYHAYLNLSDGNMYSMDGTNLGTGITLTEANTYCVVYDAGATNSVSVGTLALQSNGYPMIVLGTPLSGASKRFKFVRWNGSAWTSPVNIINQEPVSSISAVLRVISDSTLDAFIAYKISGETYVPDSEVLFRVRSTDTGANWKLVETVVSSLQLGRQPRNPCVVKDGVDELQMVLNTREQFFGSERWDLKSSLYAWGDEGFV